MDHNEKSGGIAALGTPYALASRSVAVFRPAGPPARGATA